MTDKKTDQKTAEETKAPSELTDSESEAAQGGFVIANGGALGAKRTNLRSRGNNVFGFEDLPNN